LAKNITITGIKEISTKLKTLETALKSECHSAITSSTAVMYGRLTTALSGPKNRIWGDILRDKSEPNPYARTGLEVPGTALAPGMIGTDTGKLRDTLTKTVRMEGNSVVGEVGYPKSIDPPGISDSNRVSWPETGEPNMVVTPHSPGKEGKELPKQSLQEYAWQVLLGSEKIAGRNILRVALFEDITSNRTLIEVQNAIIKVIK